VDRDPRGAIGDGGCSARKRAAQPSFREPADARHRRTGMRIILIASFLCAAACGSSSDCLPAVPTAAACPSGTYIDASATDPICLSTSGLPLCRGSANANCYVCTGAAFDDNCTITSPQMTIECVHSCDKC
jgi:hypothetical protein